MLYNMAFILDTLLNQVEVVDAYLGNHIELNISDYIELVMSKNSKEEKYKLLQELANSI
jgi:L-fucose isomerase-like protein